MKTHLAKITLGITLATFIGTITIFGCLTISPVIFTAYAAPQQNILGLDPENDPVVFSTTSGLEIKKSNAQYASTTTLTTNTNYTYTQDLTNYYYFTMGTYTGSFFNGSSTTSKTSVSNIPVNWIILGRGGGNFGQELTEQTSPAAQAIKNDTHSSLREFISWTSNIKEYSEIPDGCILVLSEKLLGNSAFNATNPTTGSSVANWTYTKTVLTSNILLGRYRYAASSTTDTSTDGSLYTYINNLFSKTNSTGAILSNSLGFTASQAALIKPQQLYTSWSSGTNEISETPSTDGGTYYTMFPLASNGDVDEHPSFSNTQSFHINTYYSASLRYAAYIGTTTAHGWWTRSGARDGNYWYGKTAAYVNPGHSYTSDGSRTGFILGVRPAFVMEFTPNLI